MDPVVDKVLLDLLASLLLSTDWNQAPFSVGFYCILESHKLCSSRVLSPSDF